MGNLRILFEGASIVGRSSSIELTEYPLFSVSSSASSPSRFSLRPTKGLSFDGEVRLTPLRDSVMPECFLDSSASVFRAWNLILCACKDLLRGSSILLFCTSVVDNLGAGPYCFLNASGSDLSKLIYDDLTSTMLGTWTRFRLPRRNS